MNTIRLLLPLVLLTAFTTFAQRKNNPNLPVILNNNTPVECGTPTPPLKVVQQHEKLMQQFIQRGANLASPVAIPIKAHIVRKSDGTGGLSVDSLNSAIAVMNTKYTSVKMSFSLCSSIHYIDSDELYYLDVDAEDSKLVLNNVNDAINVYFVGSLVAGASVLNGISAFPSANPAENRIIMWNSATNNRITLPHEMGHYWNVFHTHEEFYGKELVNGSNCSIAGDLVCDTPADPCCYFYNPNSCTYNGTVTDSNGQPYTPMVNNLMSYYGLCRDVFTAGQYARIDAGYALRTGYMGANTYTMVCNQTIAAAPTNINVTQVDCGLNITWTDNANNEMGYIIEKAESLSGPFIAVGNVGANITSFSFTGFLNDGVTYYYRVIAANSNASYSSIANVTFHSTIACYCTPPVLSCSEGDVIKNVKIEKGVSIIMNHNSECSDNGFSVDSTIVPTLEKGIIYTLSLSNPGAYSEGAVVWIDFNKNGTFENSEIVFTKANAIWTDASGSFNIPLSALSGQTRMRISLTYDSDPTDACTIPAASQGYGEIEDYWINIQCSINISFTNPSEPAGNFLATQTITSASDVATITSYSAGKSIILTPGFQAGTNEVFTASIQNISCP